MRFSILVPVYNTEDYLCACVESVLSQTFRDYELILVDDGSRDRSGEICDRYAEKHRCVTVIHQENQGLVSARRAGLRQARGEYCVFVDSDDFLECTALESLSTVIDSCGPDIIIYNAQKYEEGAVMPFFEDIFPEGEIADKQTVYDMLLLSYKINALWMKACKRSLVDVEADYSPFYRCNFGEDLLQSVPLIRQADHIYYHNRTLYNYRVSTGMMSKCSPHYYWSYKKVNESVRGQLKDAGITDLSHKCDIHLLVAAYGAATQQKFAERFDTEQLMAVAGDPEFRRAWQSIRGTAYMKYLNGKQKLLLPLLYHKWFFAIRALLSVKKSVGVK